MGCLPVNWQTRRRIEWFPISALLQAQRADKVKFKLI